MPRKTATKRPAPLNIVVLLGGPSAEREVSLASGNAVADALEQLGHNVTRCDPLPADAAASDAMAAKLAAARQHLAALTLDGVDIVFNALHGTFGEDGQAQELLDQRGVPYTGSAAAASRVAFSKWETRLALAAAGVPIAAGHRITADTTTDEARDLADALGYPAVVKPDAQGSSIGVTIVQAPEQLPEAIARSQSLGEATLLEQFIPGREWTVPVWDREPLPGIEVVPAASFYDYAAKYETGETTYRVDSIDDFDLLTTLQALAVRAVEAIGGQGLCRVDFRVNAADEPFVLEVNTSPGMTGHSLVPKSAACMGLDLGQLCEQECRLALQRFQH
ncbi:MAG: D-alanine--D-alanine ligase [Planctomycetaceae bacterium]